MRKCLGVVAVAAMLGAAMWAQAPSSAPTPAPPSAPPSAPTSAPSPAPASDSTQAPTQGAKQTPPATPPPAQPSSSSIPAPGRQNGPQFPRIEWSAGYSFAQAGFFNAGHWAQLNGWYGSFGINLDSHVGFVVDGSEFFGHTEIPTGTPAPFPPCLGNCPPGPTFNADTREYNILFGFQFPYRKYQRWTPFGELMVGHDGVRGEATLGTPMTEVSSGLGVVAGAGVDKKINERFALRIKADYLQTRTDFRLIGKAKQDNLRVSVGVVIRSVKKKRRRLEDDTEPEP